MASRFNDICTALKALKGYQFEVLCNDYLKAKHPNLTPLGVSITVPTTVAATPDAFLLDESGELIACQYSAEQKDWKKKLSEDAAKVAHFANANDLIVKLLIFCTTVDENKNGKFTTFITEQRKVQNRHGFPLEICGLRRLASDLETHYPGIAARRLGIPISLQHFMTLDAYLDSPNPRLWPKRSDVEEGKVYWPEGYIKDVCEKLLREKRCLLTGKSGAGKTGLAVAFGLKWHRQSQKADKRQEPPEHPEAVVFYLEAAPGCTEGAGEDWYRQVLAHDYQNELFVIDNCHIAPAAVNALCYQWERQPPKQALVLLISAPKVSGSPYEEEPEDYFEGFEQTEAVVEVQPEQIFTGVLKTYSDAYRRTDPEGFVPVDLDMEDPTRASQLERLCAHNLTAARSILQAWGDVGGRLSDVREEVALDGLARRHLTEHKAPALVPLSCLAQFEIPAHDRFVGQLPPESVAILRRENLIVVEESSIYGRCHRVALHPQEAAQIFQAYIRRQVGADYESRVDDETFSLLKTYLSACPENFIEVYQRLYRSEALGLQHRLLRDATLQSCVERQFARPLNEVVWYLYALHHTDANRARDILEKYRNQVTGEERRRKRVLALTGHQFFIVCSFLPKLSVEFARLLLGNLLSNWVASRISLGNFSYIGKWIRPGSGSLAAQLGYTEAWRKEVACALDVDALVGRARETNLQSASWFLQDFVATAPEQAKLLVDQFSSETSSQKVTLSRKLSGQPLSVINSIFESLKALGYDQAFRKRIAEALGVRELMVKIQQTSLQRFYWLLRDLKEVAPELLEDLLRETTPAGLANLFREKEGTAQDFDHILAACGPQYAKTFFSQFPVNEVVAILARSPLGETGALLERRYRRFQQSYGVFASEHLPRILAVAGLDEVGKFIARLQRVPGEGKQLTIAALDLLVTTDLSTRVSETDVEHLALLLRNAQSVDPIYPQRILATLEPSGAVEKALKHSGIRGIQLLLRNLSEMAPESLSSISKSLQDANLAERIGEAEIKDLGHFLWNVFAYLGAEPAQYCCQIVDVQLRSEQINNCDLVELGNFLWNLVHISTAEDLATIGKLALRERLRKEWPILPGPTARIVGTIHIVRRDAREYLNLQHGDWEKVYGKLVAWLTETLAEKHPYTFALTVKGLIALNERMVGKVLREIFREHRGRDECLQLLQDALAVALTARSKTLLTATVEYVRATMQ